MQWVPANDGMERDAAVLAETDIAHDDAGLFDKTGRGNGGFDVLKGADHASTVGELVRDLLGAVD